MTKSASLIALGLEIVNFWDKFPFMSSKPICKKCGYPVGRSYVTALGFDWHADHFLCADCNRSIGDTSFYQHQGHPYHPNCFVSRFVPFCAYCSKPLTGKYLEDYWGTAFCPTHQSEYPECRFCRRLIPFDQQEKSSVGQGTVRCPKCRAVAVESIAQARALFDQVVQWIKGQGLFYNNISLNLLLGDQEQFHKHINKHVEGAIDKHSLGVTLFRSFGVVRVNLRTEISGVAILRSLPLTLFQAVAAHELGHVWLTVHGVIDLSDRAAEGFCELLAHRWLAHMGTHESRYHSMNIEQSKDTIYGDGFRTIRRLSQLVGFDNLVETLQTTKKLPAA